MSEESIQIHDDLISGVLDVVVKNDARAETDMMLGLQYLAAVIGYIAASYPGPASERDALLEHLAAFTKHVTDDRATPLVRRRQLIGHARLAHERKHAPLAIGEGVEQGPAEAPARAGDQNGPHPRPTPPGSAPRSRSAKHTTGASNTVSHNTTSRFP